MRPLVSQGSASLWGVAGWERTATGKGIKSADVLHHHGQVLRTRTLKLPSQEETSSSFSWFTHLARPDAGNSSNKRSCSHARAQAVCKASTMDGVGGSQSVVSAGASATEEGLAEGMCVSIPINFYEVSGWPACGLCTYCSTLVST